MKLPPKVKMGDGEEGENRIKMGEENCSSMIQSIMEDGQGQKRKGENLEGDGLFKVE